MKNFREGFFLGINTWFKSWGFIFRNGLAHYFLYPIIISVLLSAGLLAGLYVCVDWLTGLVAPYFDYTAFSPDASWWQVVKEFLSGISEQVVRFFIWIIGLYLLSKMNKYIVLAIMSPIMSLLSERTAEILSGQHFPFDGQQLVRDVFRGIALAIRNFFMETFIGFAIWIGTGVLVFLTGGIGTLLSPLTLLFSFCVGAYFYGFATIDYSNERNRMGMRESIAFVRSNKGLAVGNGTLFNLFTMVPFIGVSIATVTCTVAATLALHEIKKQ